MRPRLRIAVVLLLTISTLAPLSAEEPSWPAYTVMVSGNIADLWTTRTALASGRGHEGNPALARQDIGTITIAKACGVAAIAVVMRLLDTHGHPRIAHVLGYVDGGVTSAVALHNHRVGR